MKNRIGVELCNHGIPTTVITTRAYLLIIQALSHCKFQCSHYKKIRAHCNHRNANALLLGVRTRLEIRPTLQMQNCRRITNNAATVIVTSAESLKNCNDDVSFINLSQITIAHFLFAAMLITDDERLRNALHGWHACVAATPVGRHPTALIQRQLPPHKK